MNNIIHISRLKANLCQRFMYLMVDAESHPTWNLA